VAKGLAAGYGVELYAVSSLLLTASGARPSLPIGEYLSVLDAMRGEFFAARITIRPGGVASQAGPATLISADQLANLRELALAADQRRAHDRFHVDAETTARRNRVPQRQ